jgi:hypothetical protein
MNYKKSLKKNNMETTNKIELLKIYLNNNYNDNYIGYDYDQEIKVHYFKFNDMIYSTQIVYIVSLDLKFHLITIDNNIYLAIRN